MRSGVRRSAIVPGGLKSLKGFFMFFAGQSVSQFGTSMTSFALLIWVYEREDAVLAVSLLSVCGVAPYLLCGLFGGALIDRMEKKKVMLVCDTVAALGSLFIWITYFTGSLRVPYLYIINAVNGFMNAFQGPASEVAVTLLVPRKYDTRIGGLRSTVSSGLNMLAPILAAGLLAAGGLSLILAVDLGAFLLAFLSLAFIRIPRAENPAPPAVHPFRTIKADLMSAFSFLRKKRGLLYLLVFFGIFNFIGSISFSTLLSPMILARTGNNEAALGIFSSVSALNGLIDGLHVSVLKPAAQRTRVMFLAIAKAFLWILLLGVCRSLVGWCVITLLPFGMTFYFSYEGAVLREHIPVEMQGRIFSVRGMLSQSLLPLGCLLGGILADYVFEPFMIREGRLQSLLSLLVGRGSGAGMGLVFVLCGFAGLVSCLIVSRSREVRALDGASPGLPLLDGNIHQTSKREEGS